MACGQPGFLACHPSAPDLSQCVSHAHARDLPVKCRAVVESIGAKLADTTGVDEFVPSVSSESSSTGLAMGTWQQSEEWRGHALYWQDQYLEQLETARGLENSLEEYRRRSTGLSQQLKFCHGVLQSYEDKHKKEMHDMKEKLQLVVDENSRLASLLGMNIHKGQEYDALQFKYKRLSEEHDQLKSLVDSMSTSLSCYLELPSAGVGGSRERLFSGEFFAAHPCDPKTESA